MPGLMAVGEAACVSVHGANRLGSNSLIDLVVFGRAAGARCAETVDAGRAPCRSCRRTPTSWRSPRLDRARHANGGTPTAELRGRMQKVMQENCAVFRTGEVLEEGHEPDPRGLARRRRHPRHRPRADLEHRPDRDAGIREPDRPGGRDDGIGARTAPRAAARMRARTIPTATTSTG